MQSKSRIVAVNGAVIAVASAVLYAQDNPPAWIEVELSENTYTEQDRAMRRDSMDTSIPPWVPISGPLRETHPRRETTFSVSARRLRMRPGGESIGVKRSRVGRPKPLQLSAQG